MAEKIDIKKLTNGMVILGVPMQSVQSAAFGFMVPCGASVLPNGCCGASSVIEDWIFRGAGANSSKELSSLLDSLGLHRAAAVSSAHLNLSGALEAENLAEAIALYADIILKPSLDENQFEYSKQLASAELAGLEDDPRQKIMLQLRQDFYPEPLGANPVGAAEDLANLSAAKCSRIISDNFNAAETILAVAGSYDFEKLCSQVEKLFGSQQPKKPVDITVIKKPSVYNHHDHDGSQVHIGVMTETIGPADEDYYNARVAVAVLSGGMSSRLFTEVREKRGLCYAVGANYHSLKEYAGIGCYAGTTPDKAQETYDVIISEFKRLAQGIEQAELDRAKIGLKSALVMQSESTMARARSAGSDYYVLNKIRSLDEVKQQIEKITVKSVLDFLNKNPFEKFSSVTIGPTKISV